jgi:hypothetical protein
VEGAGAEFKKIQNAIRFKEMMSTSKNEFLDKIDKIENNITKVKSSNGFWKTLLKVGALLGVIVYLWKTKIQDNIPNLSKFITDISEVGKNFVGDNTSNIFDRVGNSAASAFTDVIKMMATEEIPSILETFFNVTLPKTLLGTYVGVLSGFSDDAAERYNKEWGKEVEQTAERTADAA